jgi:hypothetical protein
LLDKKGDFEMKKLVLILAIAMLVMSATAVFAETPTYTENWDGRGSDSERCGLAGQEGRPESGWIHWVFNTKGDSTDAKLILGGTGSGTYAPGAPLNAEIWHFYTPFYELDGLTAKIELFGGNPGPGGGLVISDYCPGKYEDLEVTKTVKTSYTRTHKWDIKKWVVTEYGHELEDGTPKIWLYTDGSGDELATWKVKVNYMGYDDSNFKVYGDIFIKNTGTLDAVLTDVSDSLAGVDAPVTCEVDLPYTLLVGNTLKCTYQKYVDSKIEGNNIATVTTERDTYNSPPVAIRGNKFPAQYNKAGSFRLATHQQSAELCVSSNGSSPTRFDCSQCTARCSLLPQKSRTFVIKIT